MKYEIIKLNEEINYIRVDNENKVVAELCNFGASIRALHFDKKPIILEASREEFPFLPCFYNKTLARVAGRIKCHGVLDGVEYNLDETMAEYSLHGGDLKSQSYKPWEYKIKEAKNKIQVIFSIRSKNKELGFPGAVNMQVIYEIYANNNFKMIYKAKTPTTTLVSMSNHNYYNFFSSHDLSEYKLKVNASKVSTIDENLFITGEEEVQPMYDFRKPTKLSARLKYFEKQPVGTIDFTYIFDSINAKKPQIELKNSEMKLLVYTDYPSANIYVDNGMKEIKFEQYKDITPVMRRAIALEPQMYVRDYNSLVLRKGQKYQHFIMLKFKDLRK